MVGIRVRRAYRGSAFFRRRRCGVSTIAAVTAAVVLASLVSSPPAWAEPAPTDPAGRPVKSVPVSGVQAEPATVSQSQREPWSPSGAAWPAAGVSVVDLPVTARARAGGLPVWAGRPSGGSPAAGSPAGGSLAAPGGPSRLRVEVLDRAAAERANVAGVLLRLSWVDSPSAAGAASVEVDYSGFRGVFGADWAARLGLVRLPACVLVSPAEPGCSRGEPLDARNNPTTGRVWADVAVAAQLVSAGDRRVALALGEPVPDSGGTVLAVMSVESSDGNGPDFSKTPLSPAFSWQAGTQSGDFSWSYPLRSPPAPAGAAPSVSLGYSSGAVDGRTNGQGAQTSWLGEGWSYEPGYVERAYRSCADDVATYRDAKLYPGNGTGGFVGTSSTAGVAWDSNGTLLSPGDVTGDGRVDLVFREATGPRRRLFLATGNGSGFDEPVVWDQGDWTAAQLMFSPGDFSGDGRADVIYRDAANANLFLRRGAAGGGLEGSSVQIGTAWGIADWIFSPGDFTGDGKADVIYRNGSNNNLYLVPGNGTGGFVGTTYQIGTGWGGLSPIFGRGDFSGDGNPDVIYRNSSNNNLYLVPGNGVGGFVGTTYQIGIGWGGFDALVVAGDVDGDGKPDVVGTVASAKNPYYPNATGDECWRGANATIVWGGHSTELVLDDATGVWRLADDDGSRVELLTGTTNGDNNGEYWRLTTTEGTQYFFGRNRLPGWQAGQPETRSAWTVPVFANHSDEPCFSTAGFSTSWCKQAWRWNLDHVVDPRGNSTSYWYSPETNVTSLAGNPSSVTGYERGGTLARIDYGTRTGAELTGTAAAQVVFTPDFRCLASCGTEAAPNTANWPDTPFDLRCTGAPCGLAPSFWSTRRLAKVTTRIWGGPAYWDVDEWSLAHAFLATGDTSSPSLWLASITHTGKAGGSLTLPAVTFGGTRYANRTDFNVAAGVPPTNKYRITTVGTGTGGQLQVGYEASDCTVTSQPVQDANTNRCFYQYYAPPGSAPGWSLWNKYRVNQVIEQDLVGGSPDVLHTYGYSTAGSSTPVLWHHNDAAWSTPAAKRSWSTWRGYATVTVTTGTAGGPRTTTSSLYFRGMHADRTLAGGDFSRTATITDSEGVAVNDDDRLAGFLREQITLDGPGGPPLAGVINDPWQHQTARRQLLHVQSIPHAFSAGYVRTAATRTRTWLAWSSTWRRTQATTTFENTYAQPTDVQDQGDTATSADDTCTHTDYARNTTANLIAYPSQTIVTDCTPNPGPANHLAGSQILYDGSTTVGAAPTQGLPTKTLALATFDIATPVWKQTSRTGYDTLGRPTSTRAP